MATELSMNGRKKIETIQKEFTSKFPYLTLVFLDVKRQTIDISKSLSEVRKVKGDDVSIIASLKVNTLEKRFLDNFGIIVEVAYQKQEKLIFTKDNVNLTLNELNKWCSEHKCDKFQFAKSLKGNTLMSIQDQLLQAIKEIYPLAEAKKINKDNFLDIYIPEFCPTKGTHFYFNIVKDDIKIGFYSRDEEFIERVLSKSNNIETYSQGLKIQGNPTYKSLDDALEASKSFILQIIGKNTTSITKNEFKDNSVDNSKKIEVDEDLELNLEEMSDNQSDNSSNLLNDFFKNLILNFPSVELKEIKENDFVHIYMPDLYLDKAKSHFYFIIKNDKIEIGFYVLDKDFINNVLQYSEKIEVYKNDLRLKGNPNFENDFPDAFDAAMTFILEVQKCIASSLEVDDEDFSISEGLDDFSKFNITEEDIINKLSQKIKNENVIPELLFINNAFEEENIEVNNHQAYFFTSDVLISDRELQGFLYVDMDGFYSNCLEEDFGFLVTWDVVIDMNIVQEIDGIEIEIKTEDGELTIKEKNSKSLKILYSFYKNVWKKVADRFKNEPIISWGEVADMGITVLNFESIDDYIIWSNQ